MPRSTPSTHTPTAASKENVSARMRRTVMSGCGTWLAGAQPPPRLPAGAHGHRPVHLDDVEPAVVGVGPRGGVPLTDVIDVHHGDDPAAPPAAAGRAVGRRRGRRRSASGRRRSRLMTSIGNAPRRRAPSGSRANGGGRRPGRPPGADSRALVTAAASSPSDCDHDRVDRDRRHVATPRRRLACTVMLAHRRSPRRRRFPGKPSPATSRATARVGGSGATSATWRARSISCFIVRTKSPPVTSSSPTTVLRACPAIQPWAAAKKPGSGGRWLPSPLARSSAARSSLTATMRSQRCRAAPSGNHGGAGGSGLRCSWTNTDSSPASSGASTSSSRPSADAFGDQQVTLVEHAGEHRALVGQRPAVVRALAGTRGARARR